ncbi:MAG: glycosyltransferase [Caenispirillum sp.]|nr:glycosyltransferase [Caenispirillum sp.]
MRITHVVFSLDPAWGGPPAVVPRLAAAQAALGHDVVVLSYGSAGRSEATETALRHVPGRERVRFEYLPEPDLIERLLAPVMRRRLQSLRRDVDILHLHGVWEACLRVAASEAAHAGVPYAVAPHGMLDPWSLRQGRLKKQLALAVGYRRMLRWASFLHVLNDDEARFLAPLRLGTPAEVIPNGVFLEEMFPLPSRNAFAASWSAVDGRPFILFLARLHYKKGLDLLAQAFAAIAADRPDWMLVVAGPEAGAGDAFRTAIAAAGLSDRVLLTGPLYGAAKLEALAAAACFCLPSRQEGFSVGITEALAAGVPVVMSDACHFGDAAEAGAALETPLSVPALAEALARVTGDAALRDAMGARGRALVQERFTWPRVAAQSLAVYDRALAASDHQEPMAAVQEVGA